MFHGSVDKALKNRTKWPSWLNRAIDSIAENPNSVMGRLVALRYQPRGPLPAVSAPGNRPIQVIIGPVNYSNQATLWAQSLCQNYEAVDATNFAVEVPGGFDFPAGVTVPVDFYERSSKWQTAQSQALALFSHVLVEAEQPLLGRFFGRSIERERTFLKASGQSVAYIAHGTDVRIPELHSSRTVWSPYKDSSIYLNRLSRLAQHNINFLNNLNEPVFVSTPDLMLDLPNAFWCPVVVEPEAWQSHSPRPRSGPVKVVHMPSVAVMKGTQLIEPTLHELNAEAVIDYSPISSRPAIEMPSIISTADVVLDQFRLGSYGVAACEAMAAGKVVIGHVLPEVRALVEELTGLELPIVEATPDTLRQVLLDMANGLYDLEHIGTTGKIFVSEVHDGRMSSRVLCENWIEKSGAVVTGGGE